ncbi:UDP-glucosyltransferase 2-like [Schistocerca serialis cubense]|uniref:UDP-glucosyltransferase 2-like n=1 Tax=Schistocerca serialis cubense TaxID=2023355 RepID=UPI00214EB534|nr:UDP-glucosyltransferase 2-like [Schistocerca serialis cubense]
MGLLHVALLCLLALVGGSSASRILFIVPSPSVSHTYPINKVVGALLARGHHVTHLTADPVQVSNENYTLLDVSSAYSLMRGVNASLIADSSPIVRAQMYHGIGVEFCHHELNLPQVKEWVSEKHVFDLVVMERLPYQCFYGLLHSAGYPPLVGILTLPAMVPAYYTIGNPTNPAYLTDIFVRYSDHMSFWERLCNTLFHVRFLHYWFYTVLPEHEALMRKYLGPEPKSVYEVERNFSMILMTVHFSGDYPRPHLPSIVEVTGLHVSNKTKPLPKDIKDFLDGAKHGVIYFSLGSNVRSATLPEHKKQAFIDAFRELPQRVIWKFEEDTLTNLPPNVLVRKWLPQQDILAHRNVKLFVMQGGLQSLNEAALRAIPLVGIPFFSDQEHNCGKIVSAGIGVRLRHRHITKEAVLRAVRTVLEDRTYSENMKQYSKLFREHWETSLDKAVWWLEYMIRHKGAPHLRSAALDLHWWQLLLLDVIGFILLVAVVAVTVVCFVLRWTVALVFRSKRDKAKTQ